MKQLLKKHVNFNSGLISLVGVLVGMLTNFGIHKADESLSLLKKVEVQQAEERSSIDQIRRDIKTLQTREAEDRVLLRQHITNHPYP